MELVCRFLVAAEGQGPPDPKRATLTSICGERTGFRQSWKLLKRRLDGLPYGAVAAGTKAIVRLDNDQIDP